MISHTHRCIFIHIPKNAGNSVNRIFGVDWQDHKDLNRYATELPAEIFHRYYKFAIVRNPWERIFSDYNYQKKKSRPGATRLFLTTPEGERRRFSEWVKAGLENPHQHAPAAWGGEISAGLHRLSPQVDWISLDGRIAVDCVIHLEQLRTEFAGVCRAIGIPPRTLPHRNRRLHWHYSWYYDEPTQRRVEEFYHADIDAFGYQFETAATRFAAPWRKLAASPIFTGLSTLLRMR